jgi:hypothetical protein
MKVGDKIKCIQNMQSWTVPGKPFTLNKIYSILELNLNGLLVSSNFPQKIIIRKELFNDYFINITEERKLKLKKLNESR